MLRRRCQNRRGDNGGRLNDRSGGRCGGCFFAANARLCKSVVDDGVGHLRDGFAKTGSWSDIFELVAATASPIGSPFPGTFGPFLGTLGPIGSPLLGAFSPFLGTLSGTFRPFLRSFSPIGYAFVGVNTDSSGAIDSACPLSTRTGRDKICTESITSEIGYHASDLSSHKNSHFALAGASAFPNTEQITTLPFSHSK